MKKLYYAMECGVPVLWNGNGEWYLLTVSSEAENAGQAVETVTGETGGPCFGPSDAPEWAESFLKENWGSLEEMTEAEADARLKHLASEWYCVAFVNGWNTHYAESLRGLAYLK